jgi:hypothetical protein
VIDGAPLPSYGVQTLKARPGRHLHSSIAPLPSMLLPPCARTQRAPERQTDEHPIGAVHINSSNGKRRIVRAVTAHEPPECAAMLRLCTELRIGDFKVHAFAASARPCLGKKANLSGPAKATPLDLEAPPTSARSKKHQFARRATHDLKRRPKSADNLIKHIAHIPRDRPLKRTTSPRVAAVPSCNVEERFASSTDVSTFAHRPPLFCSIGGRNDH